jgi:hypothetical protein
MDKREELELAISQIEAQREDLVAMQPSMPRSSNYIENSLSKIN